MAPLPFTIVKKAGREDRFTFNDTPIDDYLTGQQLRDAYFQLSGQAFKVGQTTTGAFPRKVDLINECQRLIGAYVASPKLWDTTLENQEKKRAERERRAAKKAAAEAARELRIQTKAAELSALSSEEFEILQAAMARAVRMSSSPTSSDTE